MREHCEGIVIHRIVNGKPDVEKCVAIVTWVMK